MKDMIKSLLLYVFKWTEGNEIYMKYGLLYYKDTDNIGDDIQAYATSRFLLLN